VRVHDHVDADALLVEREIFLLDDETGDTLLSVAGTKNQRKCLNGSSRIGHQ